MRLTILSLLLWLGPVVHPAWAADCPSPNVPLEGYTALFNGEDLTGWKVDDKLAEHWKVIDGVLDYDARASNLWTEDSFGDFILLVEWRLKTAKELYGRETDEDGSEFAYRPDSGIYLRGTSKAQTNIWTHPMGSGEVWGYRTDQSMPEEVRTGATPSVNADKPLGAWNQQKIVMRGNRLTVVLNGRTVIDNALLPGVPESGPIALQHHGHFNKSTGRWGPASACVQFRNIFIKELQADE